MNSYTLRVRRFLIIIGTTLLGILSLLTAAFFTFNAVISNSFNETVKILNTNIATAQRNTPDLVALQISQRQVNDELRQASEHSNFQLPPVQEAISTAQKSSAALDLKISKLLAQQERDETDTATKNSTKDSGGGMRSDKNSDSSSMGIDSAEQQKLKKLLRQNESNLKDTTGNNTSTTTPDSSTSKPW